MGRLELYWRTFFALVRVFSFLLMIAMAYGALMLAIEPPTGMDPGLRWGLFGLFLTVCILSVWMLRAPTLPRP
jgi:hypothetical protein